MKKFLFLAIAAMSVMSLSAQKFSDYFSTEKSNNKIVYGVRFGLNVMGMRNNVTNDIVVSGFGNLPYKLDIHRRAGITLGVNVDIPILKSLWINTGLYYVATGARLNFKQDFTKLYEGLILLKTILPLAKISLTVMRLRFLAQAASTPTTATTLILLM